MTNAANQTHFCNTVQAGDRILVSRLLADDDRWMKYATVERVEKISDTKISIWYIVEGQPFRSSRFAFSHPPVYSALYAIANRAS